VRSTTTGVFNELMKAFFYWATSHKSRAWLLEADVETQEDLGWRPFHTAAERGQPKSVRALAKLGADGTPQTAKARCRCIGQRQWGTWRQPKVLVEVGGDKRRS